MGRHVGAHGQAVGAGARQLRRAGGAREAADVDPGAGIGGQRQQACERGGLGGHGDAGQPQAGRDGTLVGTAR
ncbi:MAG: hypothetical protein U5K43_03815 [Halofilum sp. (in: g-proteobacteria)]|nr:hypothetical protein [Halofilum sp. (in: g-proteobacteria)]